MLFYFMILLYFACAASHDLFEGDLCASNGLPGRCVSIYNCLSAVKDLEERKHPTPCGFNRSTPIICCTDCELVQDTRFEVGAGVGIFSVGISLQLVIFNPLLGRLYKTGTNKAKDKCLNYLHTLEYACKSKLTPVSYINLLDPTRNCTGLVETSNGGGAAFAAGGRDAVKQEYPHMALLGYGDTVETAFWLCGGSVISERFILTAAHCISEPRIGSVRFIALGILKRSDPPETWQIYNVKTAILHPQYQSPSKYHDIALLETDKEISFNPLVLPACLHVDDRVDKYAYATGWGALGHRQGLADVLQSVGLNEFTEEECTKYYPPQRLLEYGYDRNTQMCFGDRQDTAIPTDTCEGDSGGPLQSQEHERCVHTILGVTSYGRQCGKSGGSGMYTRVAHYVPWIENIVWP